MNKSLLAALALAALATAGAAPAFAQPGGSSRSVTSARNNQSFVHRSGNDSYAMAPDFSNTVPTSLGYADHFGAGSQS